MVSPYGFISFWRECIYRQQTIRFRNCIILFSRFNHAISDPRLHWSPVPKLHYTVFKIQSWILISKTPRHPLYPCSVAQQQPITGRSTTTTSRSTSPSEQKKVRLPIYLVVYKPCQLQSKRILSPCRPCYRQQITGV